MSAPTLSRRALLMGSAAAAAVIVSPPIAAGEISSSTVAEVRAGYLRAAKLARRAYRRLAEAIGRLGEPRLAGLRLALQDALRGRDRWLRRLVAARANSPANLAAKLATLDVVRNGLGPDAPGATADVRSLLLSCHHDALRLYGAGIPEATPPA